MGAGEMGMGLRQWHWESECECEWHCQRTETNKRTSSKQANIPLPKVTQKTGNKNRKKNATRAITTTAEVQMGRDKGVTQWPRDSNLGCPGRRNLGYLDK